MAGANFTSSKGYNFRIVLERIRKKGPISRAEIARNTDLTPQTVSNITKRLLELELIHEISRVQEGRGAPATILNINPAGAYSIGIDMDQDRMMGILMDFKGQVRQRVSYPLPLPKPEEAILLMLNIIQDLPQKEGLNKHQIWGVGVGVPGPLEISEGSITANVAHSKALHEWKHVPIVSRINRETGLPVYLENNATAAAIGEQWFGYGRDLESYFYLYFSLGLGGGLILNNLPFRGFTGNAGEVGFIPSATQSAMQYPNDKSHVGYHFKISRLRERITENHAFDELSDLVHLYRSQNPIIQDWIEKGAELLAPVLLSIEYLIDPQAILVGGRLPSPILEALIDQVGNILREMRINEKTSCPKLLSARVAEDAAALGVATIPLYEMFTPLASFFTTHNSTAIAQPYTPISHPIHRLFSAR